MKEYKTNTDDMEEYYNQTLEIDARKYAEKNKILYFVEIDNILNAQASNIDYKGTH